VVRQVTISFVFYFKKRFSVSLKDNIPHTHTHTYKHKTSSDNSKKKRESETKKETHQSQ
jgi:hypothetical protein